MREIMARPGAALNLGDRGENLARQVVIDLYPLEKEYGEGTAHLLHRRNGDEAPYPCDTTTENGKLFWVIKEADTAVPGNGTAELQYFVGETVVKKMFPTVVSGSLDAEGATPPAPAEGWVRKVLRAKDAAFNSAKEAESAANEAADALDKGPQIGENGNWFVWNAAAGEYKDTGRNSKGDAGFSPLVQVEPYEEDYGGYIQRGHRVTVTDATKSQTFDIANGMDGQTGKTGDVFVPDVSDNLLMSWKRWKADELFPYPQPVDLMEKISQQMPYVVESERGDLVSVTDSAEMGLRGLKLFGKTTQDGTPSPENPVPLVSAGDDGSIGVTVTGKNLIDPVAYSIDLNRTTVDGDVFTSEFINATYYVNTGWYAVKPYVHPPGTYTVSFVPLTDGARLSFYVRSAERRTDLGASYDKSAQSPSYTFTANEPFILSIGGPSDQYRGTYSYKLQLEAGSVATPYEPYKSAQTLTVQTPNGLPGVPVGKGGNYTDGNGQQWVCDEIDFARGVYVKRVGVISSYGGEGITGPFLSSTGALTSGAAVQYVRPEPIETSVDAEELAAYKALKANYPSTAVLNDEGAGMELTYVADTKNYIDKKFAELAAAIVKNA